MTKQQIIVVVHSNYAEGTTDAYAFWDEKIAKESVNADVETEVKSLTEEGYSPPGRESPVAQQWCPADRADSRFAVVSAGDCLTREV